MGSLLSKPVKLAIFPVGLTILWIALSVFVELQVNAASLAFSALVDERYKNIISTPRNVELLKGQKITAEFKAPEDNLSIVLIRFDNFLRINSDSVIFRIKEVGNKDWYYENKYKSDQFQPHKYFPFGFPVIPDSKSKKYSLEIESIDGKKGDAIGLSPKDPVFAAVYHFPRQKLEQEGRLPWFLYKKVQFALGSINWLITGLILLSSFLVSITWRPKRARL